MRTAIRVGGETIAEIAVKETEERGDYFRQETSRGERCRTLALPSEVDAPAAKAGFKDGLLEVTLPESAQSKRQRIDVS